MSSDFGLTRLGQISMNARDLARATDFYRDTLGVPLLFEVPGMAFFDLGGVRLMVGTAETAQHDHPGSILYFTVDDIGSAHEILSARGVNFNSEPRLVADMGDHELWMAFFKDSEENQLALMAEVQRP